MTATRTEIRQPEWQAAVRAWVAGVTVSVERRVVTNGEWLSDNARKRNDYRETPGTSTLFDVVLTNGSEDEALAEAVCWHLDLHHGYGSKRRKDAQTDADRAIDALIAHLDASYFDMVDATDYPLAEAVYRSLS